MVTWQRDNVTATLLWNKVSLSQPRPRCSSSSWWVMGFETWPCALPNLWMIMNGTTWRLRSMWNWHVSKWISFLRPFTSFQVRLTSPWSSHNLCLLVSVADLALESDLRWKRWFVERLSRSGAANHTLRPFLGCLRGLRMNGVPVDLEGKVDETIGIRRNCTGACLNASIPCRNGGQCIDGYAAYTCDCNNTAFDGYYCHLGESSHI